MIKDNAWEPPVQIGSKSTSIQKGLTESKLICKFIENSLLDIKRELNSISILRRKELDNKVYTKLPFG